MSAAGSDALNTSESLVIGATTKRCDHRQSDTADFVAVNDAIMKLINRYLYMRFNLRTLQTPTTDVTTELNIPCNMKSIFSHQIYRVGQK